VTVEKISAVTLKVASMPASVRFYRDLLGLEIIYGGEDAYFSSLRTKHGKGPILNGEARLYGFRAVYVFDRLSRDLWPSLCALDVIRECQFRKSLDSSKHIIAQLICPAQHSLMRGWFSSCPSGLKPTRQHARICSAAAMFRTVA